VPAHTRLLVTALCYRLKGGADPDSMKGAPMADEVVRVQWLTNEIRPRSEQRSGAIRHGRA
jgi:hypothetical protein